MTETQTVVDETDVQVKPVTEEVSGAQTEANQDIDLDALLSEYSTKEEPETVVSGEEDVKVNADSDVKDVVEYVRQQKARDEAEMARQINEDYRKTVASLKGDLPVSEKFVDGYLQVRAKEDPRIASAYQNRYKNPAGWEKVSKGLQYEMRKEIQGLPDKSSNETRQTIAAAIQSAQTTNQVVMQKDLKDMDDTEFQKYLNDFTSS